MPAGYFVRYQEYSPSPRLSAIVEKYWLLEGSASAGWESILPDGRAELIFHYGDPFARRSIDSGVAVQPAAIFVGQVTGPVCLQPRGRVGVAAIRLRPEATGVFGPAAGEITNRFEPLDSVARAGGVIGELAAADDDRGRLQVLERFVVTAAIAAPRPEVAFAVNCLIRRGGAISIEALSSIAGVARRQLERRFHTDVGLSPKAFARLLRINRAARLVLAGQSAADVAVACGYFDQAHMSNDFRRLTQHSPVAWQQMAGTLGPLFVGVV
jgi:AraC-like DNA-binding protein